MFSFSSVFYLPFIVPITSTDDDLHDVGFDDDFMKLWKVRTGNIGKKTLNYLIGTFAQENHRISRNNNFISGVFSSVYMYLYNMSTEYIMYCGEESVLMIIIIIEKNVIFIRKKKVTNGTIKVWDWFVLPVLEHLRQ